MNKEYQNCTSLTSVIIPENVELIGNGAFSRSGLTSINIPNSVKEIGAHAFLRCPNLTRVNIGNGVTSILTQAFHECPYLTDICYSGTESEWNSISKKEHWDGDIGPYTIHYNYVP